MFLDIGHKGLYTAFWCRGMGVFTLSRRKNGTQRLTGGNKAVAFAFRENTTAVTPKLERPLWRFHS